MKSKENYKYCILISFNDDLLTQVYSDGGGGGSGPKVPSDWRSIGVQSL